MSISNQRGNVLLFVISGIAMAAAIGMGMFYMISTSSLGQASGSGMNRAYYLALAGRDYAIANWNNRTQLTGNEFIVSNTERFSLYIPDDYHITSTGIVNKGTPFEAKKTITVSPPNPVTSPVKKHFLESFEDLTKWATGTQVGGFVATTVGGDKALQVTSAAPAFSSGTWAVLAVNAIGAGVDLTNSWKNAGYCLSHDLQVKISNSQPFHMEGLSFKISSSSDTFYGVSYMRRKEIKDGSSWVSADNISDSFRPDVPDALTDAIDTEPLEYESPSIRYSNPAIILWKRQGGTFTWLAYKIMPYDVNNQNYVFNSSNRLIDWSNLQVRLVEAYPLEFVAGGPTRLLHGSVVVGGTSGARARINGTPIMTSETWSSTTATGTLTLTNITGTFQTGENLLVGVTTRAVVSGILGAKTNYIRVYYGDVDSSHDGTRNNIPTDNNRWSNPRIVTGSSNIVHWPVDNVSDWNAANDYMTLVQWDGVNTCPSYCQPNCLPTCVPVPHILGGISSVEANAIIEDSSLLTPNSGTIDYSGIALHATGNTATSSYFDDFAIQY